MSTWLMRRLAQTALVALAVAFVSFVLIDLAPGDFLSELRLDPRLSPATLEGLRRRYALDAGPLLQFGRWLQSLGRGEAGFSFAYGAPVAPLLWPRCVNTLILTSTATGAAWLTALACGLRAGWRPGGFFDRALVASTAVLSAMPPLLLALGGLAIVAWSDWLPTGGMTTPGLGEGGVERALDLVRHLFVPATALGLALFPPLARQVRTAVIEAREEPFLRAARGHGLPTRLLAAHTLRAAAPPLLALFTLTFGSLLSGSLLVEVVMSWPGLGPFLLEAILARDIHVIVASVVASALLLGLGQAAAELLLHVLDPRVGRPRP